MNIADPSGSTVVDYPLLESQVITSLAQRLVIDYGAIQLDSSHQNLDRTHLLLDGVLPQGNDYLKITKQGSTLLNVDDTGKLFCNANVTSPNIVAVETLLANSTHLSTHDTLVKRDHTTTTTIQDLTSQTMHTDVIEVQDDVALYGDGTLTYTPQDPITGLNIGWNLEERFTYIYRFGANSQGIGDFTTRGDGLELREPDDTVTGDRNNKIVIQVNSGTPTIELIVNKTPGEPWFLTRDKDLAPVLSLDSAGCHVRTDMKPLILVTPGNALSVTTLTEGLQCHKFELNTPWSVNTAETEIEISESVGSPGTRIIENLEILLDDLGTASPIYSRIYVKRWGVYRHTKQILWVVLGVSFRNSETSLAGGLEFRLSFNNKVVIT